MPHLPEDACRQLLLGGCLEWHSASAGAVEIMVRSYLNEEGEAATDATPLLHDLH